MSASRNNVISIVDADRDLAELLDEDEIERARRDALARVQRLSPGDWDPVMAETADQRCSTFLLPQCGQTTSPSS